MLLCMEADRETENDAANRLEQLAQVLDIRLTRKIVLPEALTGKQRELFFITAQEAIANAAKHAGAESLKISFSETENAFCYDFENDGRMPEGDVNFTGGLANLLYLAGEQGASIFAEKGETFKLSLHFAKES